MALDPEVIKNAGMFFGAILSSVGITYGGNKVMEKRKQAATPEPSALCAEHHKCFEEIKDLIGEVKSDVSYIKGRIDQR